MDTPEQAPQGSRNTPMITIIIILIIVVVAGAYYYGKNGDSNKTESENTTTITETTTTIEDEDMTHSMEEWDSGTVMEDGTRTFNLIGNEFSFSSKQIKVKKGEKVKVMLTSQDMPHDFVIDGYSNVKTPVIQPGNSDSVTFVADKAGTFTFYCSVGEHRAKGMVGQILVEE